MMTSLQKLLDSYRQAAESEREKGTYFEELILCYPIEHGIARTIAKAKTATLPHLNRMCKYLCNQIWKIVRAIL